MKFKDWLIMKESNLKDLLQPVPQSPKWHAEGSVWNHTRMVRKQLNDAVAHFKELVAKNPVFSNYSPDLTTDEMNLLRIGGYLHDIGKASATTIDGKDWKDNPVQPDSKIQALAHEMPYHFEPMMQKLGNPWKQIYEKSSQADKDDLWFMIRYHMDLGDLFGKKLMSVLSENGKFKNERRVKLLLILIMMDQTGRFTIDELGNKVFDSFSSISDRMADSIHKTYKPPVVKPKLSPEEFRNQLKLKGMTDDRIQTIMAQTYPNG